MGAESRGARVRGIILPETVGHKRCGIKGVRMGRESVPDTHWLTFLATALLALPSLARAEEPLPTLRVVWRMP